MMFLWYRIQTLLKYSYQQVPFRKPAYWFKLENSQQVDVGLQLAHNVFHGSLKLTDLMKAHEVFLLV